MYDAVSDPYCYPGTTVLKNLPGLRDQRALDGFETAITAQRADEPLPAGRLSVRHYCAVHRHLFQDVYAWAGRFRTVRIAKEGSAFCYPEHIGPQMARLFASLRRQDFLKHRSAAQFAKGAAAFLSTLNAIHPFREGNGRTQTSFLVLLAVRADHPLDVQRLMPEEFLAAMIASFKGQDRLLERQIRTLIAQPNA